MNLSYRTDGEVINQLFHAVKKFGWLTTSQQVNISLEFFKQEGDTVKFKQLTDCWHYVKRSEV